MAAVLANVSKANHQFDQVLAPVFKMFSNSSSALPQTRPASSNVEENLKHKFIVFLARSLLHAI